MRKSRKGNSFIFCLSLFWWNLLLLFRIPWVNYIPQPVLHSSPSSKPSIHTRPRSHGYLNLNPTSSETNLYLGVPLYLKLYKPPNVLYLDMWIRIMLYKITCIKYYRGRKERNWMFSITVMSSFRYLQCQAETFNLIQNFLSRSSGLKGVMRLFSKYTF